LGICGKRRRWTAEQKHKIVAEGMEPGVSVAMVAYKHGISSGQFYALAGARCTWRRARHHAELGGRRCGDERAAGAGPCNDGGRTGAARSVGRPDRRDVAR
jgi:transposase-like protein